MTLEIITGDCRTADLGGPHDLCIADPPYGDTSLEWDRICYGWIEAAARALKSNGSIWLFGSLRHFMVQRMFAQMRAHGFRLSQDIVWEKQNGTGFHNDRFRRVHEHAVLFYRGEWRNVYHLPQFTLDATARAVRRKTRPTHTGYIDAASYVSHDGGPRLERSVQEIRNEHGRAIHPTQKPVELLRKLIRYSVPPGGSVVDLFGGSAASAVAAELEGMSCRCIEIDPGMAELARKRLRGEPSLFADATELAAAA